MFGDVVSQKADSAKFKHLAQALNLAFTNLNRLQHHRGLHVVSRLRIRFLTGMSRNAQTDVNI